MQQERRHGGHIIRGRRHGARRGRQNRLRQQRLRALPRRQRSGRPQWSGPDACGGEAEHTAAWLVAHIKNPKAHNPGSRMPSFEGHISDKDLLALGAYLASLK